MSANVIAVLDIGKTNKKTLLYDYSLNLLEQKREAFPEIIEDGLKLEQPETVFDWFCDCLKEFAKQYNITAISITTHGATCVCIDDKGGISVPALSYTNTADEKFRDEFFKLFGDRRQLQQDTATAEIGNLVNLGKLIYFIKAKYPQQFDQTRWILNYPQYFGFRLTGNVGIEPTMLGCHTYLYDQNKKKYSSVAEKLGIVEKLPPKINHSWDVLGKVNPELAQEIGLSNDCLVTLGVHDSNASLIPYLACNKNENFALNSTGTWCVAMSPAKKTEFSESELGKTVFYNMDIYCNPVKTSVFMGGLEHETYSNVLSKIHNRSDSPAFDANVYKDVVQESKAYILPSVMKGTGIFPDSTPRVIEGTNVYSLDDIHSRKSPAFFNDYEYAYAVLTCSLVIQTTCALNYTGYNDGGKIYIEGGFRKNKPYLQLLTAVYPHSEIAITDIQEATAFGSAILALAALKGKTPTDLTDLISLNSESIQPIQLPDFKAYTENFLSLTKA